MTDEELEKIIEKIDFEEKWLFSLYAENRLSTGDIDIAMSGIRSVIAELKGDNKRDCETCKYSKNNSCAGTETCHECMWHSKWELKGENK